MERVRRAEVEREVAAVATDDELVRMVRGGAYGAFDVLVRRHTRRLRRAVRTVLRDDADVEDAVQQTFLQAFLAVDRFEGASSFSTWVTRIAVNEARRRVRRRSVVVCLAADPDSAPSTAAGPEQQAAAREAVDLVRRAVVRLPPKRREVFCLRHVEGLSVTQAAARLGITELAVRLRLHRACRVLRVAAAGAERSPPAGPGSVARPGEHPFTANARG